MNKIVGFLDEIPHNGSIKQDVTVKPFVNGLQYITGILELDRKVFEYLKTKILISEYNKKIIYRKTIIKPIILYTKTHFFDIRIRLEINGEEIYNDIYGTYNVRILNGECETKQYPHYEQYGANIDDLYPNRF